jgi:hypothetical protein
MLEEGSPERPRKAARFVDAASRSGLLHHKEFRVSIALVARALNGASMRAQHPTLHSATIESGGRRRVGTARSEDQEGERMSSETVIGGQSRRAAPMPLTQARMGVRRKPPGAPGAPGEETLLQQNLSSEISSLGGPGVSSGVLAFLLTPRGSGPNLCGPPRRTRHGRFPPPHLCSLRGFVRERAHVCDVSQDVRRRAARSPGRSIRARRARVRPSRARSRTARFAACGFARQICILRIAPAA